LRELAFCNFRIVDFADDFFGSLIIRDGRISKIIKGNFCPNPETQMTVDGRNFPKTAVLMPSFIDLHAHFRDPAFYGKETALPEETSFPKETLESASLASVAGGFTTVVCMANTKPAIDTLEKVLALKTRSDALSLIDLYPVMSLTKNMAGTELSGIRDMANAFDKTGKTANPVLMLSEDGKDIIDEKLFLAAMCEARRLGIPVSCHCDFGGSEAEAVSRAIFLGKKAGCRIHIAHVSTGETVEVIRKEKGQNNIADTGFSLSCEATPHHIGATEADAHRMGEKSFGRVNPPLADASDRKAIAAALIDGTIDAIATDHAPHSQTDKASGAPGFVGLETAFAVCLSNLAGMELKQLSQLMSKNPAQILGLHDRGRIAESCRADIVIADTQAEWKVNAAKFKSRGSCTPFDGAQLNGKIIMTINAGRIVFQGDGNE
jgi:dihydroorotase